MFTSNAVAASKTLGKRKMREAAAEAAAAADVDLRLNLQGPHHHHASSSRSQVRKVLNNSSTAPFSYMALLTADDVDEDEYEEEEEDDYEYYPISNDIKNQSDQINQTISYHNENLKQSVLGLLEKHNDSLHRAAEQRAAKRLKQRELKLEEKLEQNAELERVAEHYKGEAERLRMRVRYLERTAMELRETLQEANAARHHAETVEEEGESSYEHPDRVGPVRLDCKVCARQLATVMVWPCRHVCVCKRCDTTTKYCPVCRSIKTTSVEVCLPLFTPHYSLYLY